MLPSVALTLEIREHVPLAPLTTFELGGSARFFVSVQNEGAVVAALDHAGEKGLPVLFIGGGSNLVIGDAGFAGLVVDLGPMRGLTFRTAGDVVEVEALAGEPWDPLVDEAVARDLAGLECLSGIPGLAGATPIQNVGAYGQEVAETVRRVRVFDRVERTTRELDAAECGFAYRDSAFKRVPDRHVVLAVTFALAPGAPPAIRYAELERALGDQAKPSLARVRQTVIGLRRRKSMVIDPNDENRRSAGSFFTNPIVSDADAERVVALALAEGIVRAPEDVPRYPAGEGHTKLAAGWLIERAGIDKGHRRGRVRVSTRHALALTHLGGGKTEDLLALAREVRDAVQTRFAVTLVAEPNLINCVL
jgi:UDP-N-acetylmuramate dehydrogenase